jgi:hypothetical protein
MLFDFPFWAGVGILEEIEKNSNQKGKEGMGPKNEKHRGPFEMEDIW